MSELDALNEFRQEYMGSPYRGANYLSEFHGDRRFTDIFNFLDIHYKSCRFFNGFSIAKPDRRTTRNQDVFVGCSCGDSVVVAAELWHHRLSNVDLEDIIEDLNYQRRQKQVFSVSEIVDEMVNHELNKRKMREDLELRFKSRETQEKKGSSAIMGLEVEDS